MSFFDVPGGPELPAAGSPSAAVDAVPLDGSEEMTGGLQLAPMTSAAAPNETLFANTGNSNKPSWKDSSGTLFDLTELGGEVTIDP